MDSRNARPGRILLVDWKKREVLSCISSNHNIVDQKSTQPNLSITNLALYSSVCLPLCLCVSLDCRLFQFRTHDTPASRGIDLHVGIVQNARSSDTRYQGSCNSHGNNQWIGRGITEPVLLVKRFGFQLALGIHKGVIGGGRKSSGAEIGKELN